MSKLKFVVRAALAVAGPVLFTGGLLAPVVAEAQQKVSAPVGEHLKDAQAAIKGRKWDSALAAIQKANGVSSKTAFDQQKINEMLLYVYLQQGRYNDAARMLEQQLASGDVPAGERVQRTKTLSQTYFRAGNYGKAITVANQYLKSVPRDQEMQLLVANAYYQQKDSKNAIAAAERMMKSGQQPSQDLLQLVLRSNYELKDSAGTAKALDQLLRYYPSEDTWKRVLDGFLDQTKDDVALAHLYRLAQDVGIVKSGRQYNDMAQALVVNGYAIEAQGVMERAIAANMFTGEDLTRAQRTLESAKRRADAERKALPNAASALAGAKSGEEMFAVAKLLFSSGDYAKAADAARKAIAKGGLANADDANMLLGISLARIGGKNAEAGKAFDAVTGPKLVEIAKLWKLRLRG
jgi:tetratricopeptide (TPR) repeat protein